MGRCSFTVSSVLLDSIIDTDYPYSDGGANRTIRVNYDTAYSPTLGFVRYSSNSENIYNNALWKQT